MGRKEGQRGEEEEGRREGKVGEGTSHLLEQMTARQHRAHADVIFYYSAIRNDVIILLHLFIIAQIVG